MQTSNLLALTENSLKTAKDAGQSDRWLWGRVTGLSPVAVLLDGETHAIYPSDVLCALTVGMRVLVRLSGMRATVMGADGTQYAPVEVDSVRRTVVRPGVYKDGRLDPPIGLSGSCRSGMVSISWGGKLGKLGGVPYVPPNNFDHLVLQEAYASGGDWNDVGAVTSGGLTLDRQSRVGSSLWYRGVSVDIRGERFEPSEPFEIPVSNQLAVDVQNALSKAEQAGQVASAAQDQLATKLGAFQSTIDAASAKADAATVATTQVHNDMVALQSQMAGITGTDDLLAAFPWFGDWNIPSPYYQKQGTEQVLMAVSGEKAVITSPPLTIKKNHQYLLELDLYRSSSQDFAFMAYLGSGMPDVMLDPMFPDGVVAKGDGIYTARFSGKATIIIANGEFVNELSTPLQIYGARLTGDSGYITLRSRPRLYDVTGNSYAVSLIQELQAGLKTLGETVAAKPDTSEVEQIVSRSASGKNTIVYSGGSPSGVGSRAGDTWFRRATDGTITGQWEWDGAGWQPRMVDSQVIASLDVGKLTAGTVVTPEAVIEKLWTDGLNARTVNTARLTVAAGSLWLDDKFETGINSFFQREVKDGRECLKYVQQAGGQIRYWESGMPAPFRQDKTGLVVELDIYSTAEITGTYPQVAVKTTNSDGVSTRVYAQRDGGSIPANTWRRLRYELDINQSSVVSVTPGLNMNFVDGAAVWVANPRMVSKTGTVLIEDGAITAPKLTVDQSLVDKLTVSSSLWAGKISTEMLKVGNYVNGVSIDRYGVKIKGTGSVELTAGGLVAKNSTGVTTVKIGADGSATFKGSIEAGSTISAPVITGGTIDGTVITGATLQTAKTGRRLVITSTGLQQYDTDGQLFAQLDDDELRFYNGGNVIGRFDRGWTNDSSNSKGIGIALAPAGQFISLGIEKQTAIEGKIWIDRSGVRIEGNYWAEVRDKAFNAASQSYVSSAMQQANSAMSQASQANATANSAYQTAVNAINGINDINNQLVRIKSTVNAMVNTFNSYGNTFANGAQYAPGQWGLQPV